MNIPKHWATIPLRQLVVAQKGKKPLKLSSKKFTDSTPYLDIKAVEKGKINQYADAYSTVLSTEKDIFVVADGSRSGLVAKGMPGAVGSTIICLTPLIINQHYLFHFLRSKFEFLNGNATGASIPHLNQDLFYSLEVPVPTIQEQEIIVAGLEERLKSYERDFQNVEHELVKLTDYRKSVLEQAVTGKLTEAWRIKTLVNHKTKPKIKFDEYEFPGEWEFITSNEVFEFVTSGSRSWSKYYSSQGALFIRIGNLSRNSLDLNLSEGKVTYVELPENPEGIRTKLQKEDILISITGEIRLIGYIDDEIGEAYINQHIALARPKEKYYSKYLAYFLLSSLGIKQLNEKESGVTRAGLGLGDINSLQLFIPSIEEQQEIVRRIEQLFGESALLEQKFSKSVKSIEKLQQSVLQIAFSGGLFSSNSKNESTADFLSAVNQKRIEVLAKIKDVRKKQSLLKTKNFMSSKDPKKVKEYIKEFALEEYKNYLEPLSNEDINHILDHVKSIFNGIDYDDFAALFLEMVQDKINDSDEEPFFIAEIHDGKIGFQIRK